MVSGTEIKFCIGDLVFYLGPPIVNPLRWDKIVSSDNGIINKTDVGIIVDCNSFLRFADVYFQINNFLVKRICFSHLKHAE